MTEESRNTQTAVLEPPTVSDGTELWRLARDSRTLDVNSPYSYLLWCRDFASTSVVARMSGDLAGFTTGYFRPDAADTLVVWQIAVASQHRGHGVARRMLDHLSNRMTSQGCRYIEATVTPDNTASSRLFGSFARDRGAPLERTILFDTNLFPNPGGHEPEYLFRIGPLS